VATVDNMTQFIDTHCHLYLEEFREDIQGVVSRARDKGVSEFFMPNVDSATISAMLQLENDYQPFVHAMMGLHPCSVKATWQDELNLVEQWLGKRKFRGLGEVGLDYYWDRSFDNEQKLVFGKQAEWARELDIPLIIHSRDSIDDCLELVRNYQDGRLKGIFHCFTGTVDAARAAIGLGFYLGIGGVVTYKNGGLDKVLDKVGLDNLVLETDAPYLSPVPFRGKRNESSYLPLIAEKIATIVGVGVDEVARVTTANAHLIFNA